MWPENLLVVFFYIYYCMCFCCRWWYSWILIILQQCFKHFPTLQTVRFYIKTTALYICSKSWAHTLCLFERFVSIIYLLNADSLWNCRPAYAVTSCDTNGKNEDIATDTDLDLSISDKFSSQLLKLIRKVVFCQRTAYRFIFWSN